MSTIRNLVVTGTASGLPAALPEQFLRKAEFDSALAGLLTTNHPPVTVTDTASVHLILPSGTQSLSAAVRRRTSGFAPFEGAIIETVDGLAVQLGSGENQAARGSDLASASTLIGTKADATATASALVGKSNVGHTHPISDVVGLQAELDALAADEGGVGGSGALKYATGFGDGVATAININHNLATSDVIVQVRRAADPQDVVDCDQRIVDANNVLLSFSAAPASGSLRVVILG